MRAISQLCGVLLVAGTALGQHRGGMMGGGAGHLPFGHASGDARIAVPAAPRPFEAAQFGLPPVLPIPPLGAPVPNRRPLFHHGFGFPRGSFLGPALFPIGFPAYVQSYAAQPAPPAVVVVQQPLAAQSEAPPPAREVKPEIHEYAHEPSAAEVSGAELPEFALAFRDGSVRSAVAVWSSPRGLHYIDSDGRSHLASPASLDRERTRQLNRERGLRLLLP